MYAYQYIGGFKKMTFDEIMAMLLKSCNKRFKESVGLREKLLDCATQIYIAEMREKNNAEIPEKMD